MDSNHKFQRPKHPRANANVFEIITFSWMLNLFKIGLKRDLEINDLYIPLKEYASSTLGNDLEKKWRLELALANNGKRKPSLLRALTMLFGTKIMFRGLTLAISEIIFKMIQPILIGRLLSYFNTELTERENKPDLKHAYIYATCLVICTLFTMILYHMTQLEMVYYGKKMRIACCSVIYRKAMRLSSKSLGETSVGRVVNLLSNDVHRFNSALFFLHYLWVSPLQTVVVTYLLWQEIGVSSIFGVATLIMFIPLQVWFGKKISKLRLKTAIRTDGRVHLMNEIISGIQVIKMYTWEKPFEYLVQYARKMEIKQIRGSSYIRAVFISFTVFQSKVAFFFSIIAYVVLGNYITAQKVFVISSYYSILRITLTVFFPQAIAQIAELLMTIKRIQVFLSYEEKNSGEVVNLSKSENLPANNGVKKPINNSASITTNTDSKTLQSNYLRIVISNATARWNQNEIDNSLRHINLTIRSGELVAIIGPVGAGKSSLMQAILRELPLSEGSISVRGVVSYASQEPWLFVGSVQKNILFGSPMDEHRYNQVIKVCALKSDFEQFPYGDKTIVGERGVTLSGGQRARINLARAIYKQADIYLLDDPLSAVDTHVGSHLFEKCIKGFLKEKTCILITHQLQYLTSVEKIIVMENASILSEGTFEELQTSNLDFAKLLRSSVEMISVAHTTLNAKNESDPKVIFDSETSVTSSIEESKINTNKIEPTEVNETRSSGNISRTVYMSYFFAGGRKCKILFFILICIITQVISSFGDSWISYWINLEEHVFRNLRNVPTTVDDHKLSTFIWWSISRQTCINVFAATTLLIVITTAIRSVLFVSVCMKASMTLHNNMFNALTKATIYFFNTNPSGRVLNRFSKDMGTIDESLPISMMDCIHNGLAVLGVFIVVGIVNVYMTIAALVLAFIFYKAMICYLSLSRSIKRLEGTTQSPVFTHLNATLQGLTTIRAFEAEQILTKEFDNHQDLHSSACYLFISLSRGFAFWLDIICLIYMSIVTFSFVAIGNGVFGGNVGLAISQAFALQGLLQWGLRQTAELENNMTAVERVLEYTNVTQEDTHESTNKKQSSNWPSEGQIMFKNFYLRYGPDTAYVINNLNINIESMQKVGIVGRTGAGKSSLISALFRLAFNEGNIIIDGLEIHELGLNELRSKLSIIPQEPVLFSGTMRKNLDPFDEYPDHILWNALDEVELKSIVEDLPDTLNSKMSENGSNFSVGQRQLVCLARAIVRNNKILVLDEATANVDPKTDALIQMTLRNKFRTCTVLTIAHRLNTVMDSDKVLVMDKGTMVEFDHPYNLLQNKKGVFYKMVEQTGPASSNYLHSVAAESHNSIRLVTEQTSESFVDDTDISTKNKMNHYNYKSPPSLIDTVIDNIKSSRFNMDSGNKHERPSHPRANANILEILTFGWIYKLFKTGGNRDLEINDLYATLKDHTSSSLGRELEEKWKYELANAQKANRSPSLTKALIKMFGVKFLLYGLLQLFVEMFLRMSQPLLIGGLLSYFNPNLSKNSHNISQAYTCAIFLALNMLVTLFMYHGIQIEILHCGMKIRIACCSLIFRKALRLSKTALGKTTVGQVVNLLSNDVNRFDTVVIFLNYLWIGPLQTIVVTYFLWQEIGVSSIIGVAILLMVIPIQGWIGKKISEYRLNTAIRTDERVRLMNEIISGIQVIKMYTWEKPFANFVEYARRKEINEIKGSSYCRAVMLSFASFHTRIAMVFSLFSYVLLGNYISAQQVFVITSYYNLLRTTMTGSFPKGIETVAEMRISIKRLQNFLLYDEKKELTANHSKSEKKAANSNKKVIHTNTNLSSVNIRHNDNGSPQLNNIGILVNNATAKWTDALTENSLENINLTVIPGKLVGVIGPVGAGKSSLLQAILRELPLSEGKITVHGVVSYASQEPWLFNGSVQQNILFGSKMDNERYKKVIQVCALKTDLEQFPYGDKTVVGERGASLSGGQKARINLARAVYKQADIYLLDDPLSAVDTHVGKHLFRKCIKGYLREKTCILVTHQVQYLSSVDQIILMHKGNVLTEGSYQELQKSNFDFTRILKPPVAEAITISCNENISKSTSTSNHQIVYSRQVSIQSIASSIEDIKFSEFQEQPAEASETRTSGSVSKDVYSSYLLAGGSGCKILFFFIICIFTQVLASGGDFWMAYWVNLEEHVFYRVKTVTTYDSKSTGDPSTTLLWWSIYRETCFIVFGIITLILIVAIIIRSISFVSVCMKSSMTLHNNMFSAITRATMYFFNTNSSGRILNRFSKDMGAIDEMLPSASMDCIQIGFFLISVVIVIGIINFYLMIPSLVIMIIFYKCRVFYLSTSRSIKRLEGVTRSPVFAHLNASLQGLTTIRAYGAEQILSNEFDNHQDLHSSAWYIFISSSRAFGLWLDIVCFIYITIVTFSFLIVGNTAYGGNVGLAITQAISLAGMFQWGMRQSAELENQMTSVERVLEYTNISPEDPLESSLEKKPPTEWPMSGQIIFKNFYLRYGIDSPFVVKNLNINIQSMEKIGIVGRTGAGKSSLIGALFRLAINEGNIIIDNIEIHDIGLHELRSKLSIIPQEPILFSGTMRTNLDPFNEYPDHILWNALDEVELRYIVENLPNGLNSIMSEGGSNFSVGQRQLVCLARAIVRNNKILVLDEATANVDPQTDALIQNTIKNKFRMCTVLTIAHRLNTVMDSDKVLVMDAGTMVEFDHPHNLLKDKNGYLCKMVEQTGSTNAELLYSIASESYERMITTKEYLIKSNTVEI